MASSQESTNPPHLVPRIHRSLPYYLDIWLRRFWEWTGTGLSFLPWSPGTELTARMQMVHEAILVGVVGLARNPVLQRRAARFMRTAEKAYERSGRKQRRFHEIRYAAQTWDRQRRVIVKAERLPEGPNCRFVITNLDEPPRQIYDGRYTARGDMENRIKEQQLGLFADRTSCHRLAANQFRLLLASAAYLLMSYLRRLALRGTKLARAQVGTIRLKVLKIAA